MDQKGFTFYLLDSKGNLSRTYHNCYCEILHHYVRLYRAYTGFNVAIINLAPGDRIEQAENEPS
jgi:hypothetical protein